jgi:hypothetical protein
MPTKNINTNTNINKININIPKPRQPKPKSINQAEQELKDLESKDYQYSRTPNVSLSINPNVYGFNTTPLGEQNRVFERPPTPTISIEEQQAKQAEQQERTRQAQEEIQRQEEMARQQAEFQEQQDELFRGESMSRSGLGSLRQSYFQTRGGNDFQSRIPIAQAYPSEYEGDTENEKISTKLRNTPYGRARIEAEQRYLDKLQEEKEARDERKRKGRKAGGSNRPKEEIQKEKQSKEEAKQKREEGKQKAREMRAKQEEEDKIRKQKEQEIVKENMKKIEEAQQAKQEKKDKKKEKEERKQMKGEDKPKKGLRTRTNEVEL